MIKYEIDCYINLVGERSALYAELLTSASAAPQISAVTTAPRSIAAALPSEAEGAMSSTTQYSDSLYSVQCNPSTQTWPKEVRRTSYPDYDTDSSVRCCFRFRPANLGLGASMNPQLLTVSVLS